MVNFDVRISICNYISRKGEKKMKIKIKLRDNKELLIFKNVKSIDIVNDILLIHYRTKNSLKSEPLPFPFIEYWELMDEEN